MSTEISERYIEFREPRTEWELEQMLRLRYSVRRSCKLAALCLENDAQIDLDQFDRYAHHVGLFTLENKNFVPVGYSRVVTDQLGPQHGWVSNIGRNHDFQYKLADPAAPLPSVLQMPSEFSKVVLALHNKAKSEGELMGESCGAVLRPDIRSMSVATKWVEAIVAYFKIWKAIRYVTMTVASHHAPFYFKYGFQPFHGIPNPWGSPFGVPGSHLSLETLPNLNPRVDRVFTLAQDLANEGKIIISSKRAVSDPFIHPISQERTTVCIPA